MKPIYINGIGILSRCAENSQQLQNLINSSEAFTQTGKLEFETLVPSSKLRRCSNYIKLACETVERTNIDTDIDKSEDKLRVGTILSTGYGASESNTKFTDSVTKENPAICSPAVFSGTVPNSCLGQMCIIGGYKGVSTLLTGGDPLEYASILLNTQKADRILCGSIEEYFSELAESIYTTEAAKGMEICEGGVIFSVSLEEEKSYCKITDFSSASFSKYPYVHKITIEEAVETISSVLNQFDDFSPNMILNSNNGTYFDDIENNILSKFFPNSEILSPKKQFGETLGCGYMMNIAMAAAILKSDCEKNSNKILVTGIDTAGNYLCCKMEA